MTSEQMTLLTGKRITSDDGMVAWLIMRMSGFAFQHRIEDQSRTDSPVLMVDGEKIRNSLGVAGFIGDLAPSLWPEDNRARANARSMAADAFGSLHDFKAFLPMAITEQFMPSARLLKRTAKDFTYFIERWRSLLERKTEDGPFLFGQFSAVDAFNAPLAARCVTYGLEVDRECEAYIDAVMSYPIVAEWQEQAGRADEVPKGYDGVSLSEIAQPVPVKEAAIAADTDRRIEAPVAAVPVPNAQLPEDDDEIPFRVDVESDLSHSEQIPDPEPTMVRPQSGNRLFPRNGKRLFQPNYRSIAKETELADALGDAETSLDRPVKASGIKPIGGEIRRRR